jgi:hypothetical protein
LPTPTPKPKPTSDVGAVTSKATGPGVGAATGITSDVGAGIMPTKPKGTGAGKKAADPWAPVLSFGQSVIDTLSTPLYGVEGFIGGVMDGKDPIAAAGENATAWTRGKRPITGSDLLKKSGADPNFWSSLALDVALDPLTYTPGVLFTAPFKAVSIAAKASVKAGKLANKGEIVARGAEAANKPFIGTAKGQYAEGFSKKPFQAFTGGERVTQISGATETQKSFLAKYLKKQEATKANLEKYTYRTILAPADRTAAQATNDVLASAFIAGKQAMIGTLLNEGAKNTLRKYARRQSRIIRKTNQTATGNLVEDAAKQAIVQTPKIGEQILESVAEKTAPKATPKSVAEQINRPGIVDSEPSVPEIREALASADNTATVKNLKTILANVEKAAKGAKVTTFADEDYVKKIRDEILAPQRDQLVGVVSRMPADAMRRIKAAIVSEDGASPLGTYLGFADSSLTEFSNIASLMSGFKIVVDGKLIPLSDIAKQYGNNLGAVPKDISAQLAKIFDNVFLKLGNADGLEKIRLNEIAKLLDKETAEQFKLTGALNPTKKTNKDALDSLLASLPKSGAATNKKYSTFDELIYGLKRGDQIASESLLKVIKALDPEGKMETQVEKAMGKDAFNGLKDLLTGVGVKTFMDVQDRIRKADPETMFKGTGIAAWENAAIYLKKRLNNEELPTPSALGETRQAAAQNIAKRIDNGMGDLVARSATSLSRAFDNNFEYIADLKFKGVSLRGDAIARNTAGKKMMGTRAARYLETNENFGTKLYGSLMGRTTGLEKSKAKSAISAGKAPEPIDRLDDLITTVNIADDILLASTGSRLIVKSQAKPLKKGEPAHYAFLHLGDFAAIAKKTINGKNFEDLANKVLFPNTGNKYDSISTVGLMEAIRMVVQRLETNSPIDHQELVGTLLSKGEDQKLGTKKYQTELKGYAEDLAKQLERPEIIKEFLDVHTVRMLGNIEDSLQPAKTMTEDIFEAMYKGWRANHDEGITSVATRMQNVRNFFNEYALAADIFNQANGPAAEAVFKAAALMFVKDGNIEGITKGGILPVDVEEWEAFREAFNNYFKTVNPKEAAPAGREHLPFPTSAKKAKAQNELTDAEIAYATHAETLPTLTTKAEIKEWGQTFAKLQKQLDKARENAWYAWLPTRHYRNGKWVATSRYNHKLAVEAAEKNRIILTIDGGVDRGASIADSKPRTPKTPKQTPKQKAEGIKARDKATKARAQELAEGAKVEGAANALTKVPEIEQLFPGDPAAQALRILQESMIDPIIKADIPVMLVRGTDKAVRDTLDGETRRTLGQRLASRLSATAGRREAIQVANKAESTLMNAVQNLSSWSNLVRSKYIDVLSPEQLDEAFTYAKANQEAPENLGPAVAELVEDLRRMLTPIHDEYATGSIPNDVLDRAFEHFGLTEKNGFLKPSSIPNKENMLDNTPFGKNPFDADDTDLARQWNERKAKLKNEGLDPFIMLTRYAQALQFAKTELAIGQQFAARFSHAAEGLTVQQALDKGYVMVKTIPGTGIDLSAGIPANALFHPYFAEQFGAMNRHWTGLYGEGAQIRPWLRTVLDVTGVFKATQTILRPGHHMTNLIGDVSSAILAGTRNPADWGRAVKLAINHAGEDIRSNWGKNQLETRVTQTFRSLEGVGGRKYTPGDENKTVVVAIGGKKVSFTNEELTKMLEDNNVLINNIFFNDTQGLYESVMETALKTADGPEKEVSKTVAKKLKEGYEIGRGKYQQAIKPAGDFASYYGNIARTAHALKVMQSRNFRSVEDMMGAVNDTINRYHPTIQSLASWERKYPRAIFTYYTWLRVAHNAMIDMAMNHTSAMTFIPKAQYQQSQEAGNEPRSFGRPWDNNASTPSYLNYSLYGPTYSGPRGPMVWKPAILPMDVLDTYNFSYDPAYSMDENAAKNTSNLVRGVVGKNLNLIAQPVLEGLTGANPATGRPSQVKDAESFMDKLFSMTGFYGIAKGTGLYTPPNKTADSTNPLTQRDRDLLLQNWLLGLKQQDVNTPANLQNAQSEQSARYAAWLKQYMEQNK